MTFAAKAQLREYYLPLRPASPVPTQVHWVHWVSAEGCSYPAVLLQVLNTKERHVAARFSSVNVLQQQLPVSTSKPLESPTHETTASPQRTPSLYTKPAPMPKPMHAHTKHERPTAKRSAATNDTSLTNDQRNKLDHAMPYMPVRALYTHTSTTRAVPCASACPHTFHARRAALCYPINPIATAALPHLRCEPNLRRLAVLICQADLTHPHAHR